MKVKVNLYEIEDFRESLTITVDDKHKLKFMDGEPEDSNLRRDFKDCKRIPEMLKLAHEAGKRGEELTFEETSVDPWASEYG